MKRKVRRRKAKKALAKKIQTRKSAREVGNKSLCIEEEKIINEEKESPSSSWGWELLTIIAVTLFVVIIYFAVDNLDKILKDHQEKKYARLQEEKNKKIMEKNGNFDFSPGSQIRSPEIDCLKIRNPEGVGDKKCYFRKYGDDCCFEKGDILKIIGQIGKNERLVELSTENTDTFCNGAWFILSDARILEMLEEYKQVEETEKKDKERIKKLTDR